MVNRLFHTQISQGLVDCGIAAGMALLVMLLVSRRSRGSLAELPLAQLRGIVQILAVGVILASLLRGPRWISAVVLAAMMVAAAAIVRNRAHLIPGAFAIALGSIVAGAGSILTIMIATGVIPARVAVLIPVGSMVIAQSMNMQSIFLDRLRGDVLAHAGHVESALALGASAKTAVAPYLQAAFHASLIPSMDNIRSLGIVWIPGLMAGMVLSGSSPLYSALYQFVVLSVAFSAAALTCYVSSHLVLRRLFTPQEQLASRREN